MIVSFYLLNEVIALRLLLLYKHRAVHPKHFGIPRGLGKSSIAIDHWASVGNGLVTWG